MFQNIFVEEQLLTPASNLHEERKAGQVKKILDHFKKEAIPIDRVENYFGRTEKPYLQKRTNLNLYLGEKRGQLIKKAPPAYGYQQQSQHYYFIYNYNCIYECEYCYLQGYFSSPDLVFFLNYEDIVAEMEKIMEDYQYCEQEIWFHGGEFSDSLALSHVTDEWPFFWQFFEHHPRARLELRTKSVQVKSIIDLPPLPNVIISFSLNPDSVNSAIELRTPSLPGRLKAIDKLLGRGFKIGIHLDPIIDQKNFKEDYTDLARRIGEVFSKNNSFELLEYISLGTVRFVKKDYQELKKNYPNSKLISQDTVVGFDHKIRYPRPKRVWMMNFVKDLLLKEGFVEKKIYFCMEA